MLSPLISIIVPCYNQAPYLDECLQSVLDQTYQNWECIIIDDGSSDDTEKAAKYWIEKDRRFLYYRKQNGGVSSARNLGIKESKGAWILPLDGDDKIGKDYLRSAIEKAEEGFDLVYCAADYFGVMNREFDLPDYSFKELLKNNVIFCSALFKKEKLNGLRYDENLIHGLEDWEFWISYLSQDDMKVFRLPETHFFYRIKEVSRNQLINNDENKIINARMYIFNKHQKLYDAWYGNYFRIIDRLTKLEIQNEHYKKIINSKKYRLIEKVISLINKVKP